MPKFLKPECYLPHRKPMLLIDEVISLNENRALVFSDVKKTGVLAPFLNTDGTLDGFFALELFSQAVGVWSGYQSLLKHKSIPPLGMILSARDLKTRDLKFKAEDRLYILVDRIIDDEKIVCFDGRIFNFKINIDADYNKLESCAKGRVDLTTVPEEDIDMIFSRHEDEVCRV
jgi:predicted hotdog family 3-hydroxylacyl-ACP dehydratase